jgi:hypothetical protein
LATQERQRRNPSREAHAQSAAEWMFSSSRKLRA